MPFDTIEAKKIINSLRAHTRQPGGELMERAANMLDSALADAVSAISSVRAAEAEATKAKTQYQDALLENKRMREEIVLGKSAITVLQEVAETKKGASAKAADWLTANNLAPVTAPAKPAVVPPTPTVEPTK